MLTAQIDEMSAFSYILIDRLIATDFLSTNVSLPLARPAKKLTFVLTVRVNVRATIPPILPSQCFLYQTLALQQQPLTTKFLVAYCARTCTILD